jgi:predicted amidophosphoribosyltransferase
MVDVNPKVIEGKWRRGYALDIHTISSTLAGHDAQGRPKFNTVRSPIGELVNRLKYAGDRSAAPDIVAAAVKFLSPRRANVDVIVPVPWSTRRSVQPVDVIADGIGAGLHIPVVRCVSKTRATSAVKGISPELRAQALNGVYSVTAALVAGKRVLLIDDVFDSGATMNAITSVLLDDAKVATVYALTMTWTRSGQ